MQVTVGLSFFAPAPLLPLIIADYEIGRGLAGVLISVVMVTQAIISIPGGFFSARIGIQRAYLLGWILAGAGLLTPLAPSFFAVLLTRLLYGLGVSLLYPATGAVIVQWLRGREVPIMNALNSIGLTVGVSLSLFLGPVLSESFGWRGALAVEGGVAFVSAVLWLLLGLRRPPAAIAAPPSFRETATVFRMRNVWLVALGVVGPWALFSSLNSWLPSYLHETRGLSLAEAGATVSLLNVAGILGGIAGGTLPALLGVRKPFLIWPGLFMGVAGAATFLTPAGPLLAPAVLLYGFIAWLYQPSLFTIPLELPGMTPERAGAAWGALLTLGTLSSLLATQITGVLTDTLGSYIPALGTWAVLTVTLLFAGLLLPETGPARRSKRQAGIAPSVPS
ncbi:MAG: MFS transporter [Chloroflexi bacterium]|nr:MFS transporter [Chloroflexota bacterium]